SRTDADFDGLALHDFLPLAWEPSPLSDPAELEHYNQETARALQALALFEEAPKELSTDPNPKGQELQHLEAKVDVLLSLVTRLASQQQGLPKRHNTVLRADSLEWTGPAAEQARTGDSGVVVIYPNPLLPIPFRLAGRVVSSVERNGTKWRIIRFEHLSPLVSVGLEKLVFRRHRRQVAIARGTDVFSKTGIHRAPKF
ncbi:MAG: PilZ domain-containing protein, partial [Gammaproteobacteria bacterium]|nr:PilZ domain-containing protein [Gammaproteobacteria bacterium]